MINLNKENGIIYINKYKILPCENIDKIKTTLGDKLYNPLYGNERESTFMFDDSDNGLVYSFKINFQKKIYKISIEPKYSSWEDIDRRQQDVKYKIKKILEDLDCQKNNFFPWGEVHYEYDPRNLIPSIEITYIMKSVSDFL